MFQSRRGNISSKESSTFLKLSICREGKEITYVRLNMDQKARESTVPRKVLNTLGNALMAVFLLFEN